MIKGYIATAVIIFSALIFGLYYDRKLLIAELDAANKHIEDVTEKLDNSAALIFKLRNNAERLNSAHAETYKQLQRLEKDHAESEKQLNELRKKPEFKAWADTVIHIDADNWLRELYKKTSNRSGAN